MKSKYQLIVLNIFITVVSIYFTYAVFDEYIKSQEVKVSNYIEKTIVRNEKAIKSTFKKIKNEIEKDRELFKEIHTKYTHLLRENPNLNLADLKEEILNSYTLNDKEVHLFLLDKTYTITHSTYTPDIGFKLVDVPDARIELDNSEDGNIHQSPTVSIDIINSEVKSYSYSKINDELYFEMGFINKKVHTSLKSIMRKIQMLTNQKSNLYRIEQKIDGSEYYDNILDKNTTKSKEEYLASKKKFSKDEETTDMVILSNRTGKKYVKYLENAIVVYIPLIKKHNEYLDLMGDFVLELYIDRTFEKELNKKTENYFLVFLLFHIFFLIIIYYFTKKYHDVQKQLNKKLLENQNLLVQNKDFISAMTNQIEAPLSVIINNYALMQKNIDKDLKKYDEQICSSLNMLENSYEDLTYIVNNDKHEYPISKLNLGNFLKQRVEFFEVVAKGQDSTIFLDVLHDVNILINKVELERLIDNNLSNAIKHSENGSKVEVTLSSEDSKIYLKFFSISSEIKNKEKIFDKNFQEKFSAKKSLGLGLSMVKSICDKYKIIYRVDYKENKNIFIYDLSSLVKTKRTK